MLREASFGKGLPVSPFGRLLDTTTFDCDEAESLKCASSEEDSDVEQPSVERELCSSFTSQRGGSSRCDAAAWGQQDMNPYNGGSAFAATMDNLSDDEDPDRSNARNAQPAVGTCWSHRLMSLESNSMQELIGILLAPSVAGQGNLGAHPVANHHPADTSAGANQHGAGISAAVQGQAPNSTHQEMNEAGPAQQLPTVDSNSLPDIPGLLQTLGSRSRPYGIGLVAPEVVRAQLVLAALCAAQARERGEAAAAAREDPRAVRRPPPSYQEVAIQTSHEDEGDADGEGDGASGRRGHRDSRSASVGVSGATPEHGAAAACRASHLSLPSAAAPPPLQDSVSAGSDQQQPQQQQTQHLQHVQLQHPRQPSSSSSPVLDPQSLRLQQQQQQQAFRLYQRHHQHPPQPMSVNVAGALHEGVRHMGEAQPSPEPETQPSPLSQQGPQRHRQQPLHQHQHQHQLQQGAAAQSEPTAPLQAQLQLDVEEAANPSRHQHQHQQQGATAAAAAAAAGAAAATGTPAARRPRASFTGNNDDLIAAMAATGLESAAAGPTAEMLPDSGGSGAPAGAPSGQAPVASGAPAMRAGGCLTGQAAEAGSQPQPAYGGGPTSRSRQVPYVYSARGSSSGMTEFPDEGALAELVAAGGPGAAGSAPATLPMASMAVPPPLAAPQPHPAAWQAPMSAPVPRPPPSQQPPPPMQLQQDSHSHQQQSQQQTPPPSRGSSWRTAESASHRPSPFSAAPASGTAQQQLSPPPSPHPHHHQQQVPRQSSSAAGAAPACSPSPRPFGGLRLALDPIPMMSPFAVASYDHSPGAGSGGPFTLSPRGGSGADCRTRRRDTFGGSTHGREEASATLSGAGGSWDRRGPTAAANLNTSLTRGPTASGGECSIGAVGASFSCGLSGLTLRTSADCASGGRGSGGGASSGLGSPGGGSSGAAAGAQKRARVLPPSQPRAATAAGGSGAGTVLEEDGGGSSDGEGDGCGGGGGGVANQRNWKAEDLPPPVAVTVTGLSRDVDDDGRRRRITVQGVFHPDRYLSNQDCIYYENKFISRSGFEKAGGSTTAKWHCSIKIAGTNSTTLGNWLTARGLPVLKGGSRKSKRQRAVEMTGGTPPPAPNVTPGPPGASPGSIPPGSIPPGSIPPGSMPPGSMPPRLSSGSAASMMPLATPSMMRLSDTNIAGAGAAAAAAAGYGGGGGGGGDGGGGSMNPAFSWPPPSPRADLAGAASLGGFGAPVAWPQQTPPPQPQQQQRPVAEVPPAALQPSTSPSSAPRRAALPPLLPLSLSPSAMQPAEVERGGQQLPPPPPPAQQQHPPSPRRPSACGLGGGPAVFRYHSHGAGSDPAARPPTHLFAPYPMQPHPHPQPHPQPTPYRGAFAGGHPPHVELDPRPHPHPHPCPHPRPQPHPQPRPQPHPYPDLQRQQSQPQSQPPPHPYPDLQRQQSQPQPHPYPDLQRQQSQPPPQPPPHSYPDLQRQQSQPQPQPHPYPDLQRQQSQPQPPPQLQAAVAYSVHQAPPRSGAAMCGVGAGQGTYMELLDHHQGAGSGAPPAPESEQPGFPQRPISRLPPGSCYPAYPPPPYPRADRQPMPPPHAGVYDRYGNYYTYPWCDSRGSGAGAGGGGGMAGVETGPATGPVNESGAELGPCPPPPTAAPMPMSAPRAPGR